MKTQLLSAIDSRVMRPHKFPRVATARQGIDREHAAAFGGEELHCFVANARVGWALLVALVFCHLASIRIAAAATFIVTNTADSGSGSFRQAILNANAAAGTDQIMFAIPGAAPFSIQPLSPLPDISESAIIDATTQPGFAGSPVLELRGDAIVAVANGLNVTGGGTTIRGLVINRFTGDGIALADFFIGGNVIQGNYLGTDIAGALRLANGGDGLQIDSPNNQIGGTNSAARNVFSGNGDNGIYLGFGASSNAIEGNFIGVNAGGTAALGNQDDGIDSFGNNNRFGGTNGGAGNVISGNGGDGVWVKFGATGNQILKNLIGLNAAGTAALGNARHGVELASTSRSNVIGSSLPDVGNVISGNFQQGIHADNTSGNIIQGNLIGLNAPGTAKVPNAQFGIALLNSSSNTIGGTVAGARNVISGNSFSGIIIQDASLRNNVQGNFVGLNVTGTAALGNGQDGILIANAGTNTLGGTAGGAGNVISGNGLHGIEAANSGARSNLIQGNFIGTDFTGTNAVGNQQAGVFFSAAPNNLVGGTTNTARNVICGNLHGIYANGASASGNQIQGNYIGVDSSGQRARGNSQFGVVLLGVPNSTVGGTNAAMRNVISGNGLSGVLIQDPGANGNRVLGNFIGTDLSGQFDLGNGEDGVFISGGVNNIVGGTTPGAGNLLSGNGLSGMEIWANASGNVVQGNLIGTDVTGANGLGNTQHGIYFQNSARNTVGGTAAGAANIIAFNQLDGVFVESGTNNLIRANSIFSNSGLGIDLGADGVTVNDATDGDVGANNLQNFPALTAALANPDGSTTISGRLLSRPNASFTIEFFSNLICDPSGNGEGQQPLGLTNVTTAANGSNYFVLTFTNTIPVGHFITATATDAATNTSEFSACVEVVPAPPSPPFLSSVRVLGNGAFQFTFTNASAVTFTVLASTNVSLPSANWTVLGSPVPIGGGIYQFTDSDSTNHRARFYRLLLP